MPGEDGVEASCGTKFDYLTKMMGETKALKQQDLWASKVESDCCVRGTLELSNNLTTLQKRQKKTILFVVVALKVKPTDKKRVDCIFCSFKSPQTSTAEKATKKKFQQLQFSMFFAKSQAQVESIPRAIASAGRAIGLVQQLQRPILAISDRSQHFLEQTTRLFEPNNTLLTVLGKITK